MNISQNEYYYYLHKTKIADSKTIESLFNEGLKSRYHFSIDSTLLRINESELATNGLEYEIINYLGQSEEYNAVVVIKIPKRYFRETMHENGKCDPAVPMFREYFEEGWDWNSIFTTKLIQGVYCRDLNKSFTNPNFCPVFDPNGCQFSDEQINNFWSLNSMDWINLATSRRKCKFEQLYKLDKSNQVWSEIIKHYSQLYGISPKPMNNYIMPEDDKILFEVKKGRRM